jgi:hypothetical protein
MNRLLSKAYRNKASESQTAPEYLSLSDTDEADTSISSQTYGDSRHTGYSGDDSWSLASSELSIEQTNGRPPVDTYRQQKSHTSHEASEGQKSVSSALPWLLRHASLF